MIIRQKPTRSMASIPAGLAIGTGISLGITVTAAMVIAWLLNAGKLLWEQTGYAIVLVLLLASFIGAKCAVGKMKRQRFLICLLSSIVFWGCLLIITALFFGCQYEAVLVTGSVIIGGSLSAGLLSGESRANANRLCAKRRIKKRL